MAPKNDGAAKRIFNKGAWTAEEDRILAQYIEIHGAKKWRAIATKSENLKTAEDASGCITRLYGLNRCGQSCRLRWLNYLRPNIKRGNITLEEEDLILRLHKLLGNRWSLIAGRLPGRTDNEIKNYWNSHLTKKLNQKEEKQATSTPQGLQQAVEMAKVEKESIQGFNDLEIRLDMDEVFDFSSEGTYGLEWINKFLEFDKDPYINNIL